MTDTLSVVTLRSNIAERVKGGHPKRGPRTRDGDLAAEIHRFVDARRTYGYRRIAALIKRERRSIGGTPVNAKRVYRLMRKHGLLLARHTGRRRPREHDGSVVTLPPNIRWCSDSLEFACRNGGVVRIAFALDCHDGEIIGWVATTAGMPSGVMVDRVAQGAKCAAPRYLASWSRGRVQSAVRAVDGVRPDRRGGRVRHDA